VSGAANVAPGTIAECCFLSILTVRLQTWKKYRYKVTKTGDQNNTSPAFTEASLGLCTEQVH